MWKLIEVQERFCNICGEDLNTRNGDSYLTIDDDDTHYCCKCGLKYNKVSGEEVAKRVYGCESETAFYDEKKDWVVLCDYKHLNKVEKADYRKGLEYQTWRVSVFERDNYTCQKCGQVGDILNAHHIKSYKKHPELRIDIDNGVTLCIECHKEEHRHK